MNDLRKEIEHQFKIHGFTPEDEHKDAENSNGEEQTVIVAEDNADTVGPVEKITVVLAPKGYSEKFASDFKNLPEEWQVFLSEREADNEAKINDYSAKLQNYQNLEDLYEKNRQRLHYLGIEKMQDWLEGLAWLDKQIDDEPAKTLQALATVYGVKAVFPQLKKNEAEPEVVERLCQLEHKYHDLTNYLQEQKTQNLIDSIRVFGQQTDRDGNLLHPYFDEVQQQVFALLDRGIATDINQAYENALWLNPTVRVQLVQKEINAQAAEAEKAKKAAFTLKGKTEKNERPLTLREEIAKNMAAFMD